MADRSYRWLLWTLVLVGALADQGSKYGVFRWLYPDRCPASQERALLSGSEAGVTFSHDADGSKVQYMVVPGVFRFFTQFTNQPEAPEHVLAPLRTWSAPLLPRVNQGALFGLGGDYKAHANTVFAMVSVAAALAIIFWSTRPSTARDWTLCLALGLILAGTLGNLYDRLIFNGVRDFLYFFWIEWPIFNVADCCLVCGASLLLLQAFWSRPAHEKQQTSETALAAATATRP